MPASCTQRRSGASLGTALSFGGRPVDLDQPQNAAVAVLRSADVWPSSPTRASVAQGLGHPHSGGAAFGCFGLAISALRSRARGCLALLGGPKRRGPAPERAVALLRSADVMLPRFSGQSPAWGEGVHHKQYPPVLSAGVSQ